MVRRKIQFAQFAERRHAIRGNGSVRAQVSKQGQPLLATHADVARNKDGGLGANGARVAAPVPSPYPWAVPVLRRNVATKPELRGHFDPRFADFKVDFPDQLRADEFLREFDSFVSREKKTQPRRVTPQRKIKN